MIPRKPYLLRALCEWAEDNGWTPMLVVSVGSGVVVPMDLVKDGKITLNISATATRDREINADGLRALARFSGEVVRLRLPLEAIDAFVVRETGEGMLFPPELEAPSGGGEPEQELPEDDDPRPPPSKGRRAHLKIVK